MNWGNWGNYGWGMGFGWIFMFLFWIVVIAVIVYVVKLVAASPKSQGPEETAIDILKKRYAKGEISKEEFEEMKKTLQ